MKGRPIKVGVEKHIRITDSGMTDMINELMACSEGESFNQVINEALFYGLPILAEKIGGEVVTREERAELKAARKSGSGEEEFYALAVRLLRENILNATINKSILSSLYNLMNEMLTKNGRIYNRFVGGQMSDTPEYLERYEAEGIKNLRK